MMRVRCGHGPTQKTGVLKYTASDTVLKDGRVTCECEECARKTPEDATFTLNKFEEHAGCKASKNPRNSVFLLDPVVQSLGKWLKEKNGGAYVKTRYSIYVFLFYWQ